MRIIVTGLVGQYAFGGVAWDYLQFVEGFRQLGHDVFYLEDTEMWPYDPINNTVSVQYIDVVLRLTVTPQITAEGTIFLKTDIENTSIDPGIATTPGQFGLDTQSAQTQVLVSNGGTVFFGGVVQNINRVSESEVPLLGSVPLIGNMFKHKSTTSTTNELLFFITPRIVQS